MFKLRIAGEFMTFGVLQFAFLMFIAEFLYPDYSVSENYISDLGVGPEPSRTIFTTSIILFGACILIASFLFGREKVGIFSAFLALSAIGSIGVGLFNEIDYHALHILSAISAFGFGGIAAITSSKLSQPTYSHVSIILGTISLTALILLGTQTYLGLGPGGMERMAAYPIIFWGIGFGAYLMHPTEQ